MTARLAVMALLLLWLAGCGDSPSVEGQQQVTQQVTLHVKEMSERLKLFWDEWPNKVKQALEGLEGVKSVENEWDRDPKAVDLEDLLFVTYDPERVTTEKMLKLIQEQGFEAEIRGE